MNGWRKAADGWDCNGSDNASALFVLMFRQRTTDKSNVPAPLNVSREDAMTRFTTSCMWNRPVAALLRCFCMVAVGLCVVLILISASGTARANPGATGDDSRFSTIHGKAGFWRVAKTKQGVWWFVSPKGQVDFLNTVTTVQPEARGRDPMGPDFVSRDFDQRDVSPVSLDRWAHATVQRVQDAGFKGIGAWSNPMLHRCDIPMTQDLNLSSWTRGGPEMLYGSPGWSAMIENAIKAQVPSLRDNQNLVGYYLDNEMNWTDEYSGPRAYFDGLPADDPNRREVVGAIRNAWPSSMPSTRTGTPRSATGRRWIPGMSCRREPQVHTSGC